MPGTPIIIKPWYTYSRIDEIGTPDPYGKFPKPDSNIQVTDGHPVTALLAGTVTNIDRTSAWGCAVTIKLDKPLNQLATHTAYLHLAGSIPVSVGQHVNAGSLIGFSGGSLACGSQKVPLGFALYNGDTYGYGPAWNTQMQYVTTLLNPVPLLNAASSGQLGNLGGIYSIYASPNMGASTTMGTGTTFNPLDPSTWGPSFSAGIQSLFGPTWGWITDPMRIIKMLVGIMCIGLAIFLLVAPEESATMKTVAKSAGTFG